MKDHFCLAVWIAPKVDKFKYYKPRAICAGFVVVNRFAILAVWLFRRGKTFDVRSLT